MININELVTILKSHDFGKRHNAICDENPTKDRYENRLHSLIFHTYGKIECNQFGKLVFVNKSQDHKYDEFYDTIRILIDLEVEL